MADLDKEVIINKKKRTITCISARDQSGFCSSAETDRKQVSVATKLNAKTTVHF